MNTSTAALHSLNQALDAPRPDGIALGNWRWQVRQRMAAVRDLIAKEQTGTGDGWLAARSGAILRERNALLGRLAVLGPQVLETPDPEIVRVELKRLINDVAHHLQRLNDLAYDDVEIELGGSE